MMSDPYHILLLGLLALPLAGAIVVALLGPSQGQLIRWISLAVTLCCLVLAITESAKLASRFRADELAERFRVELAEQFRADGLIARFLGKSSPPLSTFHPEMVTRHDLMRFGDAGASKTAAIQFYVGLDGLNVWLVALTAVLMVPAVLISWTGIKERVNEYFACLLLLQTAMTGVFVSFDIILFYVFFELTLVPLFFLIGIWGGPQRQHAARKFFIYTLTGSLITLLGVLGVVLAVYSKSGQLTFSIPELVQAVQDQLHLAKHVEEDKAFWHVVQIGVFLALMAGFAVKVPLVPFHTWLPLAHVEAPTAGSVLLAGVLLKIGVYGFLRLCLPLAPDASATIGVPLIGTLAVIGIIYGSLCSLAQTDIKKLVAYSSVAHLGFCMLGMFALNEIGLAGSLLQMVNHGLSTGALFLLVGMLYERYHTRKISDYGGMAARLRLLTCFMIFICLTSIGLPGLNGFVGEVLVLMGIFDYHGTHTNGPLFGTLAAAGIVLGAWYLLTMVRGVFFGPLKEPPHDAHVAVGDLNLREWATLVPIAVLCLVIGVYPQPFLDTAKRDLKLVVRLTHYEKTTPYSVQLDSNKTVGVTRSPDAGGSPGNEKAEVSP